MSDMELILESTATNISKKERPETFEDSRDIANRGGNVAMQARLVVESETGESVIISSNAMQLNEVVSELIQSVSETDE